MFYLLNFLLTFITCAVAFPTPGFLLKKPEDDPFYAAPSNLDSLKNGEVYNTREVFDSVLVEAIWAQVEQVAYRTTDTHGNPSHSVATVFTPLIPSKEPKLFSYQVYEDAANLGCSPSYTLATGFVDLPDIMISIVEGLLNGWYVVVPDHEGPRSAFIAGHEQGQAGLDGIQAAINYKKLEQNVPVAMLGYSGGASATVWMASIQEQYAPQLNVVGAAHGGTPVDIASMVKYIDHTDDIFSAFMVPALSGLLAAYPEQEKELWPHFDQIIRNALNTSREYGMCLIENVAYFEHEDWQNFVNVDVFTYPPFVEIIKNESLLSNVSASAVPVPKFPRYIWHGKADEVIPYGPIHQYVSEQCAKGANIAFVPWEHDEHATTEYLGLPDALKFIIQAFEGKTPELTCGTYDKDVLTLVSSDLSDVLGQPIADLINGLSKATTPIGDIILKFTHGYRPW